MRRALRLIAISMCLAGCGGVDSLEPASDATNTTMDARLVGFWSVDWAASAPTEARSQQSPTVMAIGRRAETGAEMEAVFVRVDRESSRLELERFDTRATTIGGRDYASVMDTKPDSERRWSVLRYELEGDSTLRVFGMDEKAVAGDVRGNVVPGSVRETPEEAKDPVIVVTLAATTRVLREYLERRGDDVYAKDRTLVFRRIRFD